MRIAVLGASGRVGRLLVDQAGGRGHQVVALVREPDRFAASSPAAQKVEVRRADVTDPRTFPDLGDLDVVVSTLGIRKADGPGVLVAGARALAATGVRTVWLGALGSGGSTGAGGVFYQTVMRMFVGAELAEKAEADAIAMRAGATVVHAPDLGNGPLSPRRGAVRLADYPRPLMIPRISRATAAAVLLDEAETGRHGAQLGGHGAEIVVAVGKA
ncbi:NAD(P)-dependent dehydrogenase (short-subunit alcohol dehydrogenase family) [Catenulispora sp. GP43]|uniref:NAD(P)-dependent oxidoreductase n=1 Tax=Catenulispora sp. GP43 TaxID=3156263 RepID=UPI00351269B4